MTPKERAAMQQALDALVKCNHFHDYEDEITALREALAEQAEQIAWPKQLEHPPMYPDENREAEYMAYQYRKGWNDCLARFKQKQLDQADARAVIAADRDKQK